MSYRNEKPKRYWPSYATPSICACCNLKIETSHNRTYFLTFYRKEDDTSAPRRLATFGEFQYALAVELEHGKTRGSNVTNNHPLLTALVVVAHLTEDKLYYARLWEMETSAELFNANLEKAPTRAIMKENMHAKTHLQHRLQERVENV